MYSDFIRFLLRRAFVASIIFFLFFGAALSVFAEQDTSEREAADEIISFDESIVADNFSEASAEGVLVAQAAQDEQLAQLGSTVSQTGVIENVVLEERISQEDIQFTENLNEQSAMENAVSENDTDDIDSLFAEDGDTDSAVTTQTTEIVKADNKSIVFSGSLTAELGANFWFEDITQTLPIAKFRNILRFIGRPTTDFYVTGSLLSDFRDMESGREMDIGLYELYFNYTILGLVDVAAGKRDISWGLSRMLDTNILDDKREKIAVERLDVLEEIFNPPDRTTNDSKFTVNFNVPIFGYGSVQGVAQYHLIDGADKLSVDNISVAGKIEGTVGNFSVAMFGMMWPKNLPRAERPYPAAGFEVMSTILGKNSNIFMQGLIHFDASVQNKFNRVRLSAGAYKYWSAPIMLGVAFEYQTTWDEELYGPDVTLGENWQHNFAAQVGWSHFIAGKKWTFGVEWFHDVRDDYGSVLPLMRIENILRNTDFRMGAPIFYGTEKKYGLVLEVILRLDY